MKVPRRYATEAIVIRHADFGESDRVLTLYTPSMGKVRAIAKGVRRGRSRSAGHLDLFTRSQMLVARGRNLDIITQVEALEHFSGLRHDLMSGGYAHYVAELLDSFVPDGLPNPALYTLHLNTLRSLDGGDSIMRVRAFELGLLEISGYRPELHSCLSCAKVIIPEANRFSSAMGGVLCGGCHAEDPRASDISIPALKLLRHLQTDPRRIFTLESMDDRAADEIERRLHEYIMYRLEKRPKSLGVIEALQPRVIPPRPA